MLWFSIANRKIPLYQKRVIGRKEKLRRATDIICPSFRRWVFPLPITPRFLINAEKKSAPITEIGIQLDFSALRTDSRFQCIAVRHFARHTEDIGSPTGRDIDRYIDTAFEVDLKRVFAVYRAVFNHIAVTIIAFLHFTRSLKKSFVFCLPPKSDGETGTSLAAKYKSYDTRLSALRFTAAKQQAGLVVRR